LKQIIVFAVGEEVYHMYIDEGLILVEDMNGKVLIKRRGVTKQEIDAIIKEITTGEIEC